MLDPETGELVEKTLKHEGETVREFYVALPHPVLVAIEATGSMYWFLGLLEELGIERQVGHPTEIRAAEPRKQKHDRRDAALLLKLQVENRFPSIWMPSAELRICVRCYGTAINGCACGHGCRTRSKPSL
jgi:transposase